MNSLGWSWSSDNIEMFNSILVMNSYFLGVYIIVI